jgi:lysophospholipase L1-like esterase
MRLAMIQMILACAVLVAPQSSGWVSASTPPVQAIDDAGGTALVHFHKALRRTARRISPTRIIQYGASHTAADLFTGTMRRFFQERFGDAGHGFVMPARPWKGYRHLDVSTESSDGWLNDRVGIKGSRKDGLYGLAGFSCASATNADFARVSTATRSAFGRLVSSFDVLYLRQKSGGRFDILLDGEHYTRVLTYSPTIQSGRLTVRVPDGPHTLEIRPVGDGEVRLFGVLMERSQPGVIVDSLGLRGMRASVQLHWDQALWQHQIQQRRPDLVILAYGTNEAGDTNIPIARYEGQLTRVLQRFKDAVPRSSCVLVGPTDRPIKVRRKITHRPRTDAVIAVQKRVSRAFGCGFWDSAAAMGGALSIVKWARAEPRLAGKDLIHLTGRGYRLLAESFSNALLKNYK